MPIDEKTVAGIVFAETASLRPGSGGAAKLAAGRDFVARIARKRDGSGMAKPKIPTTTQLSNPIVKAVWDACTAAAASSVGQDAGTCRHFVIWPSQSEQGATPTTSPRMSASWPYDHSDKIKSCFGPLSNPVQTGDVPKTDDAYIFVYCGVP